MSSNPNIFGELLVAEHEILKEVPNLLGDHQKILELFAKRISLHTKFSNQTSDPTMKAIIETKKFVVMNEIAIIHTQNTFQQDIAKIISRLDDLEGDSQDHRPS